MNRKLFLAGLGVIAVGFGGAAVGATASNDGHGRTIELTLTGTGAVELDNESSRPPIGMESIESYDLSRGDQEDAGHGASHCLAVALAEDHALRFSCIAHLDLAEGALVLEGMPTFSESGSEPFTLAIVGGTGDFNKARGEAHVHETADSVADVTIQLEG